MRYVLVVLLIVFILLGAFFVPLARGYIEAKTDEIVAVIYDPSSGYAANWAKAVRMTNRLLGSDMSGKLLTSDAVKHGSVDFKLHQDSSKRMWAGAFFDDGTLIFLTQIKNNSQLSFAYMWYDSADKIFKAFKQVTEREFQ